MTDLMILKCTLKRFEQALLDNLDTATQKYDVTQEYKSFIFADPLSNDHLYKLWVQPLPNSPSFNQYFYTTRSKK